MAGAASSTIASKMVVLTGYIPGALGRIVELQARYYAEHWTLGLYFEAKAATELAEFLSRFDPERDGAWYAQVDGEIVGGIFIDGKGAVEAHGGANPYGEGARLRWFIVDPRYQGHGIGARLIDAAMAFCQQCGTKRVWLTTFAGLSSARHLYDRHGFTLYAEVDGTHLTGTSDLKEQVLERIF